jgi:hypothetical protein
MDPPKPTLPNIKFVNHRHEANLIADDVCQAEVRNAGAAGYVTFVYKTDGGYEGSYRTYFNEGEGRTVRFTLPGLNASNRGRTYTLSVEYY